MLCLNLNQTQQIALIRSQKPLCDMRCVIERGSKAGEAGEAGDKPAEHPSRCTGQQSPSLSSELHHCCNADLARSWTICEARNKGQYEVAETGNNLYVCHVLSTGFLKKKYPPSMLYPQRRHSTPETKKPTQR